jgi:tRNA A37 threonylcarbamoyladenosine dehydratase
MKLITNKQHKFVRLSKIIGEDNLSLLSSKTVLVLGCGGVGGYVVEALARSNIGSLIIVDYDTVEESNINRQIIALSSTIGKKKVDVLEDRILDINKNCKVIKIDQLISKENIDLLFQTPIDYFVDACDMMTTKKLVILECLKRKIPFISSMGTGNRFDPSMLEIVDIRKTNNDPLARILRKFVKDERIKEKVMVLSSKELPVKTHDKTPGSSAFVPSSAGLMIASTIIQYFLNETKK